MNIYINFDGVLHPDEVSFIAGQMPVLATRAHSVLEHVNVLGRLLEFCPKAHLVLNTWWTYYFGTELSIGLLPEHLAKRVIGTTLRDASAYIRMPTRVVEVERHISAKSKRDILILDHYNARYCRSLVPYVVPLRPSEGLSNARAQSYIATRLSKHQL